MSKSRISVKISSVILAVAMLVTMLAIGASAYSAPDEMTLVSNDTTALAPGVSEDKFVVYDANGDQIVYYAVTADVTSDTVGIKANYHDNDNTGVWGKATVTEQVASAKEKKGYNVVASTNASYYNVSTGQPTGAFVMEGVDINGSSTGNGYPFFAVLKDGTAVIGKKGTYSTYADNVQEAIGGWTMLVWDGQVISGLNNTSKYPRSTVGITAEGKVILMVADGNQSPYSVGLTYAEQAEIMCKMGCVSAVELDGGGSATYVAKVEGSDDFEIRNSPCDGAVRSVSNSIMVISTATADGEFDHASLSTKSKYYTPDSEIDISAVGVDAGGGAAQIPESGITWAVKDSSFGTIENGVFTSTGKTGEVEVQMLYNNNVVGTTSFNIVVPDKIAFSQQAITVPYGKTSKISIEATYGINDVTLKASDIIWSLSDNNLGTFNGFDFTATDDESLTTGTITATLSCDTTVTASTSLKIGKGSDVLFDFEDGKDGKGTLFDADIGAECGYNPYVITASDDNPVPKNGDSDAYVVDKNSGEVKNGDYSLAFNVDMSQNIDFGEWEYMYLFYKGEMKVLTGAKSLGFWLYVPEDAVGSCMRLFTYDADKITYNADGSINESASTHYHKYMNLGTTTKTSYSKLSEKTITEAGWQWCSLDLSAYAQNTTFPGDCSGVFLNFIMSSSSTSMGNSTYTDSTFYIDDITVDYSDVVDDREAPTISNTVVFDKLGDTSSAIDSQTIDYNKVTVSADVAENTTKNNYTGLDYSSAKIYVDGNDCSGKSYFSAASGKISLTGAVLSDGVHSITFEICDKQGNKTVITKQITVNADSGYSTVSVVPEDASLTDLKCGSVYYLDIKASNIETIKSVSTKLWLNGVNEWELSHMTYADGFTGSYKVDDNNNATITITRTGENTQTGSAVLVKIPIRIWYWKSSFNKEYVDYWTAKNTNYLNMTASYLWNTYSHAPQIDLKVKVKSGTINYTDDYNNTPSNLVPGFSASKLVVNSELNNSIKNLKTAGVYWHEHDATLVTKNAKEATCTEEGYTGDKYCETCGSIVEYGEVIPAKGHVSAGAATCTEPEVCSVCGEEISPALGHSWTYADGVFTCTRCGETCTDCTGFVDGKYYSSGKLAQGWVTDSGNKYYFVDGVAKTGANMIENVVYVFDDNGVYTAATYSVKFYSDETGLYYIVNNKPVTGWKSINGADYYFSPETYAATTGTAKIGDFTYKFDANGKLTEGQWVTLKDGTKKYMYAGKYVSYSFIEINGKTYWFDNKGYMAKGTQLLQISLGGPLTMYVIGDDGVVEGKLNYTGIYELNGKKYYVIDGVAQHGLYEIDGGVYYFNSSYIMKTGKYYSSYTLTGSDGYNYVKGNYYFDSETGKMLNKVISEIDGVKYYFEHGNPVSAGLVTVNGTKYIAGSAGKILTSDKDFGTWVDGTYYYVHADGTVIENGFVTVDGVKYYLKNGKITKTGLTVIDGATYYISTNSGRVITDQGYWVSADKSGTGKDEYYYFDEDGKMRNNEFLTVNGSIYYIVNGQPAKLGLAEIDGALYYLSTNSGKAETGKYYVSATNGLGEAGYYYFGEDGKALDKVFYEENGKKYYIENGKIAKSGLVKVDGKYYYLSTNSGAAATGVHYVEAKNANGLMAAGYYTFGTDGAMIIG